MPVTTSVSEVANSPESKSVYYEQIKALIHDGIKSAPTHRLLSLKEVPVWDTYTLLAAVDRQYMKSLIEKRWRQQAEVDSALNSLQQDIQAFAKPLLVQAIKEKFNVDLDVESTKLRLYVPDKIIFNIDRGATRTRHSSLLDAALHNFEESETEADAFRSGSGIYTNDEQGVPQPHAISVDQFATLCRSLDLGKQYQEHIQALLTPADPKARKALRDQMVAVEKSALEATALIAYKSSDIGSYGFGKMLDLLSGKSDIQFHNKKMEMHRLRLMGFRLSGIVLFSAVAEKSAIETALRSLLPEELLALIEGSQRIPGGDNPVEQYKFISDVFANGPTEVTDEFARRADFSDKSYLTGPLIAYVPDDPIHPLKEYPSLTDFMKELIVQLRDPEYQQFFSRFVEQKDKGKFYKRTNERLKELTWRQRDPLDMGPWWRETPIENPKAEPITNIIAESLWEYLYREKRDKAMADARRIAVPTGDEDATARWNRLVSYLNIGWNVFNFAVVFVPGMGEVMLGVMVAQQLAEFAEGIEDWSKGDKDEANAHFMSFIINSAQLALMSAGHVLPKGAAPIKPSPFVDNLKPVSMPDGSTKMWNPDLTPYEHKIALDESSSPDSLGLHRHEDSHVLRLEDKHYVVRQDPTTGQHRLQHPTRTGAYAPEVEHNSAGAWKTEVERPIEWEKTQLLRRINPLAGTFSETTLEQVLNVSGVDENVLRRLHVEHELPPPLLTDSLNRFDLHAKATRLAEQVRNGVIDEKLAGYLPGLTTELPGWPESRAITLRDPLPTWRNPVTYGNYSATFANTFNVTLDELKTGQLENLVLASMSETEIEGLLGRSISTNKTVRVTALREKLAARAETRKLHIFESQYKFGEFSSDPRVGRLQADYPDLPRKVLEQLLRDADAEDLRFLKEKNRVPLHLRQQIRAARNKVRLTRAYEGLYLDGLENVDTRRLQLCSMEKLPGWSADVRMEIREFSFTGELQIGIGPKEAPIRKVLVLDEEGRYNAHDETGQVLHGADDFYSSMLQALPDAQRQALGYEIGQGRALKATIQRTPLAQEQFEQILLDNPVRKPAYDPQAARLRGGMPGYPIQRPGWRALQGRVRSLYPALAEDEVELMLSTFGEDLAEQRVRQLEAEFDAFNHSFQRWMNSPTQAFRLSPDGVAEWNSRNQLYKALRQCWQRTGPEGLPAPGIVRPQTLNLDNVPLDRHLEGMPLLTANFDHVTHLSLRNARLLPRQHYFLGSFRQLRRLNMIGNTLETLPKVITDMRYMRDLLLANNKIKLTPESVARLRAMKRLSALRLDGNPLELVPDVSQMPNLQILTLSDTGIDRWPVGLLAGPRPRHMLMDLRFNVIDELPTVAPGSVSAELIARTLVSREPQWLSAQNLERLKLYIESVGLEPERPYPPRGTVDSSFWDEGLTDVEWTANSLIWDAVEDEFGSEPFFKELRKLTESADFKLAQGRYKADLTAKVWRMLRAMEENTALREKIFDEALVPTTCVDAGAQFFNAMGVEVLVHEAYALLSTDLVEAELLTLARGKSRLDELGAIARRRVADRLEAGETFLRFENGEWVGDVDEVEVHMAYMTDLAERLDLPWQSRGMQFRRIAGVTEAMIEDAYRRVIALEEGELLAPRLLEQPFWESYLKETYRKEFDELLEGLADADDLEQFDALRKLERTLTQQAIDRAKLQRVELPFTVAT